MSEIGELAVGAYLRIIEGCALVSYNQISSKEKGKFGEIDVIAINGVNKTIYLCEVTTHLGGLLYSGGNKGTLRKIKNKFQSIKNYSQKHFPYLNKKFMFWSPYVPEGMLTKGFEKIKNELEINIEFIINAEYTNKINKLIEKAKKDRGEPFYRVLQILEHLK